MEAGDTTYCQALCRVSTAAVWQGAPHIVWSCMQKMNILTHFVVATKKEHPAWKARFQAQHLQQCDHRLGATVKVVTQEGDNRCWV